MSELTVRQEGQLATAASAVQAIIQNPDLPVEKMTALLELQFKYEAEAARREFEAALARVQAKAPRIIKGGLIEMTFKTGGSQRTPYMRLEDIDRAMRPLMNEEGFSLTFDTEESGPRLIVRGRLAHRQGHSETKQIPLALDTSGSKSATQAIGSTTSYGRRYLYAMFFNVIAEGEDDDGGGGGADLITNEHKRELVALLREVPGDFDSIVARFLKYMGVVELADISQGAMPKARQAIAATKREALKAEALKAAKG